MGASVSKVAGFQSERGLRLKWAGRGLGGKGGVWLNLKAGRFRIGV